MPKGSLLKLAIALAIPLPAFVIRLAGIHLSPYPSLILYGAAVVGAAVLLAWAAETAQLDISGSLAIAILALIAVLPEYAVDLYFAYRAGSDPTYAQYAAANMTGSNRLLLGFGWPLVALVAGVAIHRAKKRRAKKEAAEKAALATATISLLPADVDAALPVEALDPSGAEDPMAVVEQREVDSSLTGKVRGGLQLMAKRRIELMFLGIAAVYSFVIPIFRSINLFDGVALLLIYCVYLWRVSKEKREEPELIGVCSYIGCLPKKRRRTTVIGMFVAAAAFILASAEPFAESLVATGRNLGIDEFLLVQWLAPLVSESPELIVACLLAWRLKGDDAIGTLLSSKVNQWTLLVGTIPFAYLVGGGHMGSLHLDMRQTEEFILTAAQTVLGFAILLNLRFSWREAILLAALFFLQFPFPQTTVRLIFSAVYILVAIVFIIMHRRDLRETASYVFGKGRKHQLEPVAAHDQMKSGK